MIQFFIPGKPVPKGRPRFGHGRAYTPQRTLDWENVVAWTARVACKEPLEGKLFVTLGFHGANGNADVDNLAKAVLDGLQGICFANDRQVVHLEAYRGQLDTPGVKVLIEAL